MSVLEMEVSRLLFDVVTDVVSKDSHQLLVDTVQSAVDGTPAAAECMVSRVNSLFCLI